MAGDKGADKAKGPQTKAKVKRSTKAQAIPKAKPSKQASIKRDMLEMVDTIEQRIDELTNAWDGVVRGLELRTQERYERASKKLTVVKDTIREQAIVDLRNIGKVLSQLNRKALKKMPKGTTARIKDILDIENVFKVTTSTLDSIVDDKVHGNLRELQNRLDDIFRARMRSMVALDKKAKASLQAAKKAAKDLRVHAAKASPETLKRLAKATERLHKEVSDFSIKRVRAKKKDLARLDKTIRNLSKEVSDLLQNWPGGRPKQATPKKPQKKA